MVRVLEIVTNIAKENRSAMTKLYSLGAFEILLWKFLAGDLVDSDKDMVCKFLLQCHLDQVLCCNFACNLVPIQCYFSVLKNGEPTTF